MLNSSTTAWASHQVEEAGSGGGSERVDVSTMTDSLSNLNMVGGSSTGSSSNLSGVMGMSHHSSLASLQSAQSGGSHSEENDPAFFATG